MIVKAYSLYDNKVGAFAYPFFATNHAVAIRMVQEVGRDLNTTVGRHPNDFHLFHVGEFDDQVGSFIAFPAVGLGLVGSFLEVQSHDGLFRERVEAPQAEGVK